MRFEKSYRNKNKCLFNAYDMVAFARYCVENNSNIEYASLEKWFKPKQISPSFEISLQSMIDKVRNEIGEIDREFHHRKKSFEWCVLRKKKINELRGYLFDKYYIPIEEEINFNE